MRNWKRFLPARGRAAGAAAVVVVWFVAFQIWWVFPRRADLEERQDALASKRTELGRLRLEADRLPAAEAGVAAFEARLDAGMAALAGARDTAALLRRIELLAATATLSVRGYTPEPALVHELHAEWPSRVELNGGYENLRRFFERMDGCLGDVAVGDLDLQAAGAAGGGATVSATFTLTAFTFNGAAGGRAGPAADAGCRPADAATAPDAAGTPRDPFEQRAAAGDPFAGEARAPGLAGLRAADLTLQGLVLSAGGRLAVVAAPGGETYILRGGEQLLDGSVVAVEADAVVFLDRSGGVAAAREIRRPLVDRADGR